MLVEKGFTKDGFVEIGVSWTEDGGVNRRGHASYAGAAQGILLTYGTKQVDAIL